jgi:hypothetical protein
MEETVIQKILSESYNVCNSASSKVLKLKGFLEVMTLRRIGKSYKVVTNHFCSLCSAHKQRACDNPSREWE